MQLWAIVWAQREVWELEKTFRMLVLEMKMRVKGMKGIRVWEMIGKLLWLRLLDGKVEKVKRGWKKVEWKNEDGMPEKRKEEHKQHENEPVDNSLDSLGPNWGIQSPSQFEGVSPRTILNPTTEESEEYRDPDSHLSNSKHQRHQVDNTSKATERWDQNIIGGNQDPTQFRNLNTLPDDQRELAEVLLSGIMNRRQSRQQVIQWGAHKTQMLLNSQVLLLFQDRSQVGTEIIFKMALIILLLKIKKVAIGRLGDQLKIQCQLQQMRVFKFNQIIQILASITILRLVIINSVVTPAQHLKSIRKAEWDSIT